ncbi:hypothetical protein V1478_000435 [Vespula squamosa]|uniref:Transmembrane protein n=1 Tax=Vespula squamosa TaxID=30214 RepID=A0ABD2C6C8_VESSQ
MRTLFLRVIQGAHPAWQTHTMSAFLVRREAISLREVRSISRFYSRVIRNIIRGLIPKSKNSMYLHYKKKRKKEKTFFHLFSCQANDIVQRICIATTRVHKDCPQPSSLSSFLVVVSATTILIVIATAIAVAAAASRKIDPNVWLSFMWKPGRVQQKIFSDVNSSPRAVGEIGKKEYKGLR